VTGFLEKVVGEKHAELAEKKRRRPASSLVGDVASTAVRNFGLALKGGPGRRVIAELKAKSPSVESFLWSDRLDELAAIYRDNGAAAISVVTDERNFGTSLVVAGDAREATGLPVLVKDFVIDPYQVLEARAHGADAILLIARLLDWDALTGLLDVVRELGMTALVETHSEAEVKTALQARAAVIGVNNRDLDTLDVSTDNTARLARLVPAEVTLVAESGIRTGADIERLAEAGAGAFLVGSALLDADDPGAVLRGFCGE
jgi:indole-3-glycerol phosphate synthase